MIIENYYQFFYNGNITMAYKEEHPSTQTVARNNPSKNKLIN